MTQSHRSVPRILVADDREDILKALHLLLKGKGYRIEEAGNPKAILSKLEASAFDLVLLDLNYSRDITSGREGLDVLAKIRQTQPALPVIVMTAWASIDLAVETVRNGANDFIEKPWDNQRLLSVVQTQLALGRALKSERRLRQENRYLRTRGEATLIAQSKAMEPVLNLIERAGPTDVNVLITGEHGTGKGVVARMLHACSGRAEQPLITVNIGALSDTLFESELFGHVRGAFTDARGARDGRFQLADGGTLFLDEIGNLTPALQAKLLRVIETGELEPVGSSRTERVDARILSATNADLKAMASEGRFREDLMFRMNTIEIRLPPLRDRAEDLRPLADHFLQRHGRRYRRTELRFGQDALAALERHHWPGNVRELDHVIQRAAIMAGSERIGANDLGLGGDESEERGWENLTLEAMEKLMIRKALDRWRGNIKKAASQLGLGRSSLYRRLEKYEMGDSHGSDP